MTWRVRCRAAAVPCVVWVMAAGAALAAGGDLDRGFAENGVLRLPSEPGLIRDGRAVAVQKDGKIVVTGCPPASLVAGGADFAVWRFDSGGNPDAAFGQNGVVALPLLGDEEARALAIQKDGKIVVAGYHGVEDDRNFAVARFNVNGTVDTSFGQDGVALFAFGTRVQDEAFAVGVQKDGKIVVAGASFTAAAVARLNIDGSLDPSFDADGRAGTSFAPPAPSEARALAIQKDGRIVLAGWSRLGGLENFGLARFNADGSLDPSFDGDGRLSTDFGPGNQDRAHALALQKDGRIVAAGFTQSAPGTHFALVRYQRSGVLDRSFDSDGLVTTEFGGSLDEALGVAVQKDGKIVAVGTATRLDREIDAALARFNQNGRLDSHFGTGGRLLEDYGADDAARGIAIGKDGRLVVAGSAASPDHAFVVARYLTR